jgi:S-adenosylmethionine-diacylglycerol 3-amino-3-carboxypropyl transferase
VATLPRSPLQFAVVREDPRVEAMLIEERRPARVLLVGSGGCTALALRAWYPDLDITLIEPNAAQVAHVGRKLAALADFRPAAFNVGDDSPEGLSECGNFERLFRVFRGMLDLFVLEASERARRLADPRATWSDVFAHAYWPVAFDLAFADALLRTMFGPEAVQHAAPGSYPRYFQARLEAGLAAGDRTTNPWLHHVLLGCYREDPAAWPPFLRAPPRDRRPFAVVSARLVEAPSFAPFDLVHLSNVLDWMDDAACRRLAARLAAELRPGAAILWRQLNDPRPLRDYFAPAFAFDAAHDARLLAAERSLFYDQVHAGIRS